MATLGELSWEATPTSSEIFNVVLVKVRAWDCSSCATLGGVWWCWLGDADAGLVFVNKGTGDGVARSGWVGVGGGS